MPDSAAPDIRFDDISTSLGGEVVHQRLRAEIPAGQITVLMGPSGGGKTTLVRHLVGLVPPDTGRVLVGGRSVWDLDPKSLKALRAQMGVLLGGATLFEPSVFGSQTVRENLALPLHLQNVDEESIHATTVWWLQTLGLEAVADQLPEQISARMRRRVALGAAMVGGRPLIVLDDVDPGPPRFRRLTRGPPPDCAAEAPRGDVPPRIAARVVGPASEINQSHPTRLLREATTQGCVREVPCYSTNTFHALRPRPLGRLPGLINQLLVPVLGLLELLGVALPELRGTFLDGFRASRFRLFQLEGVTSAGLAQLLFVLRELVGLALSRNVARVRQFGEAP